MMTYICSTTRCHLRWIPYMWLVSFFYAIWTFVGMYLFFAQCFSDRIGDAMFVAVSVIAGLIFSNLNFRIIFYIGEDEIYDDQYDQRRSLLRSIYSDDEEYL